MGSNLSTQICCGTCGSCKKQEEANEETSETKPILHTSGDPPMHVDTQPSPPALGASEAAQSLCWDQQLSADAVEEGMKTCCPADPVGMTEEWKAAWSSLGILVTSETEGEAEVRDQQEKQQEREKACDTEEEIKSTPYDSETQLVIHTTQDLKLAADIGQPGAGREDGPCAGISPQEINILKVMESAWETAAAQDFEIKPPAENGESFTGWSLSLCAVQEMGKAAETNLPPGHTEQADRASLVEGSVQLAESVQVTSLAKAAPLMNVQAAEDTENIVDPSEAIANAVAEMHSTSAVLQETLCPGGESLEPANQLLDFLWQETQPGVPPAQEVQSQSCAEFAGLSGTLCQSSDEDQECILETPADDAEPQQRAVKQMLQLPEELACPQVLVEEEAEFLSALSLLYDVPGSGEDVQAESAEA